MNAQRSATSRVLQELSLNVDHLLSLVQRLCHTIGPGEYVSGYDHLRWGYTRKGFTVNHARFRWVALAAAALLFVAGCGGSDPAEEAANQLEQAIEAAGDGSVAVDIGDDGSVAIQVEGEDGSMVIGGGDVPDGFPIPVPDGGQVISSFTGSSDSGSGSSVVMQYPAGSYDDLVSTFEAWINANATDIGSFHTDSADGSSTQLYGSIADGSTVMVIVTESGTDVAVTLSAGQE